MILSPQHGTCVVETDHPLSEREHRRILADLHVAQCGLDDEDDE